MEDNICFAQNVEERLDQILEDVRIAVTEFEIQE